MIVGTDMPATLDSNQIYSDSMEQLRLVLDRLKPMLGSQVRIDLHAETANQLLELLDAFNADLHVAHVESDEEEKLSDQKRRMLANLRSMMVGYNPSFHFIQGVDIADRILAFSHEFHVSMIVKFTGNMGFHFVVAPLKFFCCCCLTCRRF